MISEILFRFDASSMIGFGHAMRCFALLEKFIEHNVRCLVAAHHLPEFLSAKLKQEGAEISLLNGAIGSIEDIEQLESLIQQHKIDAVILDGYQFDAGYRSRLRQTDVRVICFDDLNALPKLYCDMVINALPVANELGYEQSAPNAVHLLGLDYSLVRQEYLVQTPIPFYLRQKLLVNFGGSDIGGLTASVLKQLHQHEPLPEPIDFVVVTGAGCQTTDEIAALCRSAEYRHIHSCNHMAELLTQARMAICAPGTLVYELAYCQVPSVFFTVATNQLLSAKAHQEAGWALTFDGTDSEHVSQGIRQALTLWQNTGKLQEMSEIASKIVDGNGVDRIAHVIRK